jgi:putative transposase
VAGFHSYRFHEDPTAHRAVATALGCALEQASKAPPLRVRERGVAPPHWQKGFFDHVLRSQESAGEKWKYVRENPVRAGLVGYSSEWRYLGEIFALDYRVERL